MLRRSFTALSLKLLDADLGVFAVFAVGVWPAFRASQTVFSLDLFCDFDELFGLFSFISSSGS